MIRFAFQWFAVAAGHFVPANAFARGDASRLSMVDYTRLLWVLLIGFGAGLPGHHHAVPRRA